MKTTEVKIHVGSNRTGTKVTPGFSADGNLSVFWFLAIFLFKMCVYNSYH